MKLKLTNEQVAALWAILYHVKLGNSNVFEDALSDLVIKMEDKGAEDIAAEFSANSPRLQVVVDFEDGAHLQFAD